MNCVRTFSFSRRFRTRDFFMSERESFDARGFLCMNPAFPVIIRSGKVAAMPHLSEGDMSVKENRRISFLIIVLSYIFAAAIGFFVFLNLKDYGFIFRVLSRI